MKVVFTAQVLHYSPGVVHDIPIPAAEAFIRRGVARRAKPTEIVDDPMPPPPFADSVQANKKLDPARVKRKYVRRAVKDGT